MTVKCNASASTRNGSSNVVSASKIESQHTTWRVAETLGLTETGLPLARLQVGQTPWMSTFPFRALHAGAHTIHITSCSHKLLQSITSNFMVSWQHYCHTFLWCRTVFSEKNHQAAIPGKQLNREMIKKPGHDPSTGLTGFSKQAVWSPTAAFLTSTCRYSPASLSQKNKKRGLQQQMKTEMGKTEALQSIQNCPSKSLLFVHQSPGGGGSLPPLASLECCSCRLAHNSAKPPSSGCLAAPVIQTSH